MVRTYIIKDQLVHSRNPYIHKCCGCIHLRMGAAFSCVIWMGLSLYFAILSFQAKSHNTVMYLFGTINLVFFGVCLGTLIPIYLKSTTGIRAASRIVLFMVIVIIIDIFVNAILFIVRRDNYVQWCINSSDDNLDSILREQQIPMVNVDTQYFNTAMKDFYNCNRTWENELKFTALSTIVMIVLYFYWAISMYSYSVKLRIQLRTRLYKQMAPMPMMGNMMPA